MSVDVSYQGVPLARAATARADGDAAFVELDAPMPVGTWLEVKTGGVSVRARVLRVNEGTQPGMTLRFADGKTLPPEAFTVLTSAPTETTVQTSIAEMMTRDAPEPNAPMAEMNSAPTLVTPPPVAAPPVEADAASRQPTPEMLAEDNRKTIEMPVLSLDSLPEDDSSPGEEPSKDDDGGGGKKKKKRFRKTVIGR